jgi:soluble lytic murein transglycosylase-like protein
MGAAHVGFLDEKYGLPKGMLEYIWAKESASSMDAPDQPGPNGASGPFQIKPSMANGIRTHDFMQASDRAAQILATELRRYNGDVEKAVAAYNVGDSTLDKLVAKFSNDWKSHVPYIAGIKVENATGGSAHVTVSALAGGGP